MLKSKFFVDTWGSSSPIKKSDSNLFCRRISRFRVIVSNANAVIDMTSQMTLSQYCSLKKAMIVLGVKMVRNHMK